MPNYLHQALGEPNNERTILDYLNEDCWREVRTEVCPRPRHNMHREYQPAMAEGDPPVLINLDGDTVHKLLEKMPHLEYLAIRIHKTASWYLASDDDDNESDDDMKDHDNDISVSNEFYGAVCRLVRLKHLSSNIVAWDQHVEQVARCYRELDTLKLFCKEVTGRGLQAVWSNLGENIKFLELLRSNLKNDDVAACIENCPKLMWLRVGGDLNKVMRQAVAARSKWCPVVPEGSKRLVLICESCHDINLGSDLDDEGNQELLNVIDIRSDSDSVNDSEGRMEYL